MPRSAARPLALAVAPCRAVPLALLVAACVSGPPVPSSARPLVPGTSAAPREVIVVMRDYLFSPTPIDLVPGETVVLRVVNGGLDLHEAVIGDAAVQDAWEAAEAATVGSPPGPTPVVSVPPELAGLRLVVGSGQRVDATLSVPADAVDGGGWFVGCHIPGHWARGMVAPVRFVGAGGEELTAPPSAPTLAPPS